MGNYATSKEFYIPEVVPQTVDDELFMSGPQLPIGPQDAYECGLPTEDQERRQAARMILKSEIDAGDQEREIDDYHRFRRTARQKMKVRTQAAPTRQEGEQ